MRSTFQNAHRTRYTGANAWVIRQHFAASSGMAQHGPEPPPDLYGPEPPSEAVGLKWWEEEVVYF